MDPIIHASILSDVPLPPDKRAALRCDDLFEYSGFFEVPADDRARFNGAQLLAYAVTWRARLTADEAAQLNNRQREVYDRLIESGMVGSP